MFRRSQMEEGAIGDYPMSADRPNLPDFERPPVAEVALGVQFEPLTSFRSIHAGALWEVFRHQFPNVEEQPQLEPTFERFGISPEAVPAFRFEVSQVPPAPRWWFINEGQTELIQVQRDRFIRNWRKIGEDDIYPRYERIRAAFIEGMNNFEAFLTNAAVGQVVANQCEVTYINVVPVGDGWTDLGELDAVLTVFSRRYSDEFLGMPEDANLVVRFVIPSDVGEPVGRLHVEALPGWRRSDGKQVLRITLTARGAPLGDGMTGILRFFDVGRSWIVRGFASVTTKEMHRIWGRKA